MNAYKSKNMHKHDYKHVDKHIYEIFGIILK